MKRRMAAVRSLTLVKLPRWMAWRVMPKDLDHVAPGPRGKDKVQRDPGVAGQLGMDRGVFVGAVVVTHQMQRHPGISLGDLLRNRRNSAAQALAGPARRLACQHAAFVRREHPTQVPS